VSSQNSPSESNSIKDKILSAAPAELTQLLRDARVDETNLILLLSRKDLPETFLDEIGKRRELLKSSRVSFALASHLHASHLLVMRAMRNVYVMDLVKLAVSPAVPAANRTAAENVLIARLPQLPLGQKIALARLAPSRVLAELLAIGQPRFVNIALDNSRLTEASVLKLLAKEDLGAATVPAISIHTRWSRLPNVRIALLQRADLPPKFAEKFVNDCTVAELRVLAESTKLSSALRREISERLSKKS
jgi:hypothetical protein